MMQWLLQFWEQNSALILAIGYKLVMTVVVLIAATVISRLIRRVFTNTNFKFNSIDPAVIKLFSSTMAYLVYVVAVLIILDMFGFNTASIIALLGAAGLAVGLALRETLSNIAAGIMLLFLKPFKLDDFIQCGELVGGVREIGLFTTVLQTPDGLYISVPNSRLWGAPITNFTRNSTRRLEVIVGISYSDPIDVALEVLHKVVESHPALLETPAPQIFVSSMGESSIQLHMRAWTTIDVFWKTYWELNKIVKEQIEAAGLTIPFPQRVLTLADNLTISKKQNEVEAEANSKLSQH
ncbi:MAG: mechanosensitive ion channel family protein [Gammaproteobacteria bacterium]|nr:mechanosensitive ion channel family protein [Gammaproteobacteria bacterium]